MKARVEAERLPAGEDPDFHLKLGRGSLPDIEFTVQLLALPTTSARPPPLTALDRLEGIGAVGAADAEALRTAYEFCERTRNRLPHRRHRGRRPPPGPARPTRLARSLGTTAPGSAQRLPAGHTALPGRRRAPVLRHGRRSSRPCAASCPLLAASPSPLVACSDGRRRGSCAPGQRRRRADEDAAASNGRRRARGHRGRRGLQHRRQQPRRGSDRLRPEPPGGRSPQPGLGQLRLLHERVPERERRPLPGARRRCGSPTPSDADDDTPATIAGPGRPRPTTSSPATIRTRTARSS